jgi:glycosyltransferase involved in cell wall biosynthesis
VANGARVVPVAARGYGSALYAGCQAAQGEWIVMGDSDDSYDFSNLDAFVIKLNEGYELVMGNRFLGGIKPGAMPWKNRYIGNPILSWVGRVLFRCDAKDFHCGLRAFTKKAFQEMDLRTTGMEFASEMVIKANIFKMKVAEVPIILSPDGRSRPPHLRPWRDGWRHLRFMFLFSPKWLFIIPGLLILAITLPLYLILLSGPLQLGSVELDVHTLFYAEAGLVIGYLAVCLGMVVKLFGIREGLLRVKSNMDSFYSFPLLEIGSIAGLVLTIAGGVLASYALNSWRLEGFGGLPTHPLLRMVSLSTALILFGAITFLMSLIMGFLSLPTRREGSINSL